MTHHHPSLPLRCWHHQSERTHSEKPTSNRTKIITERRQSSWSTQGLNSLQFSDRGGKLLHVHTGNNRISSDLPRYHSEWGSMTESRAQLSARRPSLLCPSPEPQTLRAQLWSHPCESQDPPSENKTQGDERASIPDASHGHCHPTWFLIPAEEEVTF